MPTDCILDYIEKNYSDERKRHTESVKRTAEKLAKIYGADEKKAGTAALFHDMFRRISALGHGELAAQAMERDYGIDDKEILDAVRYHTTGRPGMSLLEKIIYLADAIEPGRDYPGVEDVRALADEDIDRACLLSMDRTIEYVKEKGFVLDEITIHARDYLKEKGGSNG